MEHKRSLFSKYLSSISKVGLFSVVIFVLLLLFTNTYNINYEYKKGTPWREETLYAPFDFPIRKSQQEINQEQKSLIKDFVPYYSYKENLVAEKIKILDSYFHSDYKTLSFISDLVANIYTIGIISIDKESHQQDNNVINIIKYNISENVSLDTLFTPVSAFEYFSNNLLGLESQKKKNISEFFTDENIFEPNIIYNKSISEIKKEELMKSIIPNIGIVQADERIVSKGEIIGDKTFQILVSLNYEYSKRIKTKKSNNYAVTGQLIIIFFCVLILFLFLSNYRKKVINNNKLFFLILFTLVLFVAITRLVLNYPSINIYCIPYILILIIIRTFIDIRTAIFTFISTILVSSLLVGFEFLFIQLITGCVSALSLSRIQKRSQLFFIALFVFLTYSALYIALTIIQEGNVDTINYKRLTWFAINGLLITFAYLLLYLIERLFGFTSDITLIELSNTNNKLLRQLNTFAAGTFQHSLQVANLAEEVIFTIQKGNPLLVRAGALYHDIGKIKNPVYFIENQNVNFNAHYNLHPKKSAKIIKEHINEGIKLAKKNNLPSSIINFIKTHHGKGRIEFFLHLQQKNYPDDIYSLLEYTYQGPDPTTIEQAILMMADSCEAACRSLKNKTDESIRKLVESIIDKQVHDGRFKNTPINFQDIEKIKTVFINQLLNIYHSRVTYPENQLDA